MQKIANQLVELFEFIHHSRSVMPEYRMEADNIAFLASKRAEKGDMLNLVEDLGRLNDLTLRHMADIGKVYKTLNANLSKATAEDVTRITNTLIELQFLSEVADKLKDITAKVSEQRESKPEPKLSADQLHIKGSEIFSRYSNDPGISADIKLHVISKLAFALDNFTKQQFKSALNQLGATMQMCDAVTKEASPEDALVLAAFKGEVESLKKHLDSPAQAFTKLGNKAIQL